MADGLGSVHPPVPSCTLPTFFSFFLGQSTTQWALNHGPKSSYLVVLSITQYYSVLLGSITGGHNQNLRWTQNPCIPLWLHTIFVSHYYLTMFRRSSEAKSRRTCLRQGAFSGPLRGRRRRGPLTGRREGRGSRLRREVSALFGSSTLASDGGSAYCFGWSYQGPSLISAESLLCRGACCCAEFAPIFLFASAASTMRRS